MEQVIRLSLLILGYWLVYAYVIGYRIYLEAVKVPPPSPFDHFVAPPANECQTFDRTNSNLAPIQSSIEDAVEDQITCSAATGDECPLSVGINKGAWCVPTVLVFRSYCDTQL